MQKRIAVVGAGMSGIVCARDLARSHDVVLFEKSKGVGGRMSTRRGEGWQADHGAQYFTARTPEFAKFIEECLAKGTVAEWKSEPFVHDGKSWQAKGQGPKRYVGVPGMKAPVSALAEGLKVRFEEVKGVSQSEDCATIVLDKGSQKFDQIVLAVPSAQALKLLGLSSPTLSEVCQSAPMLPSFAVVAVFQKRVQLPFDAGFVNNNDTLSWVARDSSKPGRKKQTWILHATAKWSEQHLEDPLEGLKEAMVAEFVKLGGAAPTESQIHRWRFALSKETKELGCKVDRRIGLCGDWLRGGRVQGAFLSGKQIARLLI